MPQYYTITAQTTSGGRFYTSPTTYNINTNPTGTARVRIEVEVCGSETFTDVGINQMLEYSRGGGTNNITYIVLQDLVSNAPLVTSNWILSDSINCLIQDYQI